MIPLRCSFEEVATSRDQPTGSRNFEILVKEYGAIDLMAVLCLSPLLSRGRVSVDQLMWPPTKAPSVKPHFRYIFPTVAIVITSAFVALPVSCHHCLSQFLAGTSPAYSSRLLLLRLDVHGRRMSAMRVYCWYYVYFSLAMRTAGLMKQGGDRGKEVEAGKIYLQHH